MSADPGTSPHGPDAKGIPDLPEESESDVMKRLESVHRMRVLLSFMLLPPLLFFVFLVVWFHEGFILVPIGAGLYLYMLIQFFIVQSPARRARRREAQP
jgi:hypothetical protein